MSIGHRRLRGSQSVGALLLFNREDQFTALLPDSSSESEIFLRRIATERRLRELEADAVRAATRNARLLGELAGQRALPEAPPPADELLRAKHAYIARTAERRETWREQALAAALSATEAALADVRLVERARAEAKAEAEHAAQLHAIYAEASRARTEARVLSRRPLGRSATAAAGLPTVHAHLGRPSLDGGYGAGGVSGVYGAADGRPSLYSYDERFSLGVDGQWDGRGGEADGRLSYSGRYADDGRSVPGVAAARVLFSTAPAALAARPVAAAAGGGVGPAEAAAAAAAATPAAATVAEGSAGTDPAGATAVETTGPLLVAPSTPASARGQHEEHEALALRGHAGALSADALAESPAAGHRRTAHEREEREGRGEGEGREEGEGRARSPPTALVTKSKSDFSEVTGTACRFTGNN
ncbi:hypothetical protein T492DRAFT_39167 [Pavlovales sp. CCMP2436]|nr:hypothetical protein T492DRAFT_39167 [Pavlovales sp. CCMP2436]